MNKLISMTMLLATLSGGQALAAEWAPIKMDDNTVREVDTGSVARKGPVITFAARHTFANPDEYKVSRSKVKYLLIFNRVNCDARTLAQLSTEAHDEQMALLSKQQILLPQDLPVTRDSIDEAMLNFICKNRK